MPVKYKHSYPLQAFKIMVCYTLMNKTDFIDDSQKIAMQVQGTNTFSALELIG